MNQIVFCTSRPTEDSNQFLKDSFIQQIEKSSFLSMPVNELSSLDSETLVLFAGECPDALSLNEQVCHAGATLIILAPLAGGLQIGPLVHYRQTPCLACYQEWASFFPQNGFRNQIHPSDQHIFQDQTLLESAITFTVDMLTDLKADTARQHPLWDGYIQHYALPDRQSRKQFRGIRSPGCSVCSTWYTHAAQRPVSARA